MPRRMSGMSLTTKRTLLETKTLVSKEAKEGSRYEVTFRSAKPPLGPVKDESEREVHAAKGLFSRSLLVGAGPVSS